MSAGTPFTGGRFTGAIAEADVDRVRELTNIGAGHAAGAFAQLVGRPFRMGVPRVRLIPADRAVDAGAGLSGVLFEVEGGLSGVLALLFPLDSRARILQALTGQAPEQMSDEVAESALREVGNILISHVVSAMADTLGVRMLPSVPKLEMGDAAPVLARLVAQRAPGSHVLRVETEIADADASYRGLLVFVPDASALGSPA